MTRPLQEESQSQQEQTVFEVAQHCGRSSIAFVEGLRCAIYGFSLAWNNPHVKCAQKKSALTLLGCCFLTYLGLLLLILPLRTLLFALSYSTHVNQKIITYMIQSMTPLNLALHLMWFVPLLAMLVLTNLLGYEKIFFSVLHSINPRFRTHLESLPPQPMHSRVMRTIRRTAILLCVALFLQLLRYIPYLGSFIPALWLMKLSYHLIQFNANFAVRVLLSAGLVVVAVVPWIQPIAFLVLNFHMASLALARELFDPYITRIIQLNATRGYHPRASLPIAAPITTAEKIHRVNHQFSLLQLLSQETDGIHVNTTTTTTTTTGTTIPGGPQPSPSPSPATPLSSPSPSIDESRAATASPAPNESIASHQRAPTASPALDPSDPDSSVTDMSTPFYNTTTSIFLHEYYFQLLGFAFPYMLLTSVPFVGLLFSGFSHGAAAWMIQYIQTKQHTEHYAQNKKKE